MVQHVQNAVKNVFNAQDQLLTIALNVRKDISWVTHPPAQWLAQKDTMGKKALIQYVQSATPIVLHVMIKQTTTVILV
jgi:hypothetical protein